MFYRVDLFSVTGLILTVLGFFLVPFLIGIPIMLVGWLILVFSVFRRFINLIIPKDVQDKVVQETIKSYEPYKPALKSLMGLVWDMVKVAFVVATPILAYLLTRVARTI
jgi:glucan phosphoethanolaminetransferase (alkaline phosphatase superfamily)